MGVDNLKYFRLNESNDLAEIGALFPQITKIDPFYQASVDEVKSILSNSLEEKGNLSINGLRLSRNGKFTDFLSSILFGNHTFIVSLEFYNSLNDSRIINKECIQLLPYPVKVVKYPEIYKEYRILRVLPVPIEDYIDFKNSVFYSNISTIKNPQFNSYQDFIKKNEENIEWSMVFGKRIKLKKTVPFDIFHLGKVRRLAIVSENFKQWYDDNGFSGADLINCGNTKFITF